MSEHQHNWEPDGESFTKTNHRNNCSWDNGEYHSMDKFDCLKNCEHYKVRRYTCHCGASKTVDLKELNDKQ